MILENIRQKCKENKTTFRTVEQATHIGNGVIARWDVSSPRIDTLKKVADYFGCTVDDLLKEG